MAIGGTGLAGHPAARGGESPSALPGGAEVASAGGQEVGEGRLIEWLCPSAGKEGPSVSAAAPLAGLGPARRGVLLHQAPLSPLVPGSPTNQEWGWGAGGGQFRPPPPCPPLQVASLAFPRLPNAGGWAPGRAAVGGRSVPSVTAARAQASPPVLCPHGRTRDLEALLAVMGGAQDLIYASVMEYFPTTRFVHPARCVWGGPPCFWGPGRPLSRRDPAPHGCSPGDPEPPSRRYWPVLDTALRAAAFNRGVRVRLLVSCWPHTDPSMFPSLRSLQAFSNPAAGVSVDVVRTRSQGRLGEGAPRFPTRSPLSVPPRKSSSCP